MATPDMIMVEVSGCEVQRKKKRQSKLDFIIHYTTNRISKGVQKDENSITLYKYITELCFLFVFAPLHKH